MNSIEEFKERLIVDGIASVEKNETRPERIRGGLAGFELCRNLNSMWDFQEELERRHKHETDMISLRSLSQERRAEMAAEGIDVPQGSQSGTVGEYWEYRYATAQIEYVYERLLVVWSQLGLYSGSLSARAVLRTAEIIGVR